MPEVRALVQAEIDAGNARLAPVAQVRRFHLLTKELDHDDGEVTATMKVRRASIYKTYAARDRGALCAEPRRRSPAPAAADSPWTPARDRAGQRALKREAVLRCAAQLFNEKGFAASIARRGGRAAAA